MVNPLPDGNEGESLLSAVDRLPNPKSGSLLEVQFRRLLLKCAEQTDVSNTWQRDPKFHLYVETLQDQLSLIELNETLGIDDALLEKYKVYVMSLTNDLLTPNVPPYCKKIPKVSRAKLDAPNLPFSNSSWLPKQEEKYPETGFPDEISGRQLDSTTQKELHSQKEIQEALTDELVSMASQLKNRTKAVEQAVNQRNDILDDVDTALNYSAAAAGEAQKRAGVRFKKSKIGTCMLCLALLAVGCVFTSMVVFIKFTSIMGYKASRADSTRINTPPDNEEL